MSGRSEHHPGSIPAPWALLDTETIEGTACLLERLTDWLDDLDTGPAAHECARALSLGETDDPVSIATWAEALAARLRHRAEQAQLDPRLTS